MKGIIFRLAGQAVSDAHGEDTWDDLLDVAGAHGAYTSLGSYPDEELFRIVGAASDHLGIPPAGVVRWIGSAVVPAMARQHADFFVPHTDTRSFLLTLNTVIHPEVRKVYPDANAPDFEFDTSDPDVLRMTYRSARQMCAFAEGLIEGSARYYGQRVEITHEGCMSDGAESCRLALRFFPAA